MAESKCSKFYVLVFLILGYLGTQLGFTHVGFPIWLLLTYLTVLICIRLERGKMERSGLWLSAAPLLVLLAQIFGETALPPFAGLAVFGMLVIGMFAAIGGVHYRWRELGFVSDVIGGMLYLPFGHLPAIYRTTWQSLKPKKEGKNKEVLIGVLILLPVLLISLFLLVQSDLLFSKAVRSIEDELRRFPDELLWDLLGAWLIAMLLFSVLNGLFEPWKKRETTVTRRYLTLKTVSVVLVPLIVVYCVFAVSQIYQMVLFYAGDSAYSGYAQYAREGFFTLVCAAGVNLAVVLGCSHFLAQEEKTRRTWKLCSRIFTALTFVVLACSLIRVCGYIGEYGMTRLRIQSLWGILLIFLALCAVMWKLFSPKLRLFPLLLAIIMFGYGGLCFVQSDALIAGYNVRAYLNGEHERVDFNTIECLSEDALVAVKYLRNQLDPGNTAYIARCDEILSRARTAAEEDSWKQITVLQRIWSAE